MAGDWLKIEANTPDKPEVIGIADMLSIHPAHAFGCLFMVWRWFDQHTTEGNASFVTKVTVDRLAGVTGFADAMVNVGWLSVLGDGSIALPNFGRHNGETAKQRGLTAKRVAKSKAKSNADGNDSGNASVTDGALPREREEKRREELKPSVLASSVPSSPTSTTAGRVCARLKQAGVSAVNPSNPKLLALLDAGLGEDELADIAGEPGAKGKGFAWILAAAEGRRREAATIGNLPNARASPYRTRMDQQAQEVSSSRSGSFGFGETSPPVRPASVSAC